MKALKCATYHDELRIVDVESVFARGLPGFSIVGLAGTSIKESTERVKAALNSLGFKFPAQKITINLSPSDLPKNGSHFDLVIALLIALQKTRKIDNNIFVFGELGLDGTIKSTTNLFSLLLFLSTKVKNAKILLPKDIAKKAAVIPNLQIYAVGELSEAIRFFQDEEFENSSLVCTQNDLFENLININGQEYLLNTNFDLDYKDVIGQKRAKRACLIAALGMHNIIFEGSPGCGKSMCAKRLRYIMPPQSLDEVLSVAAYKSLNLKDSPFESQRPFRAPHHTSTKSSIFGGGSNVAKIGEVALANAGVLFFDEFTHFSKQIVESLREPLEDNKIHISRVNSKVTYKTKFTFIAALNPCPCGNLLSKELNCRCMENEIAKYRSKISEPILDRVDVYVLMDEISPDDKADLSSKQMSSEVLKAFKFQKARGQKEFNGKLSDEEVAKFCILDDEAEATLKVAISRYLLSQRGIKKVLKVARSIADLDSSEKISKEHIFEALSFRTRNLQ